MPQTKTELLPETGDGGEPARPVIMPGPGHYFPLPLPDTLELHKSVTNPDTEQRQAVHLSGGPLTTEHLTLATFFSID